MIALNLAICTSALWAVWAPTRTINPTPTIPPYDLWRAFEITLTKNNNTLPASVLASLWPLQRPSLTAVIRLSDSTGSATRPYSWNPATLTILWRSCAPFHPIDFRVPDGGNCRKLDWMMVRFLGNKNDDHDGCIILVIKLDNCF